MSQNSASKLEKFDCRVVGFLYYKGFLIAYTLSEAIK